MERWLSSTGATRLDLCKHLFFNYLKVLHDQMLLKFLPLTFADVELCGCRIPGIQDAACNPKCGAKMSAGYFGVMLAMNVCSKVRIPGSLEK